jgi:hypothetical protein
VSTKNVTPTQRLPSWRDVLAIHPAAEMFPLMSPDELQALGNDIKKTRLREPVTVLLPDRSQPSWQGATLMDGRNRLDAMEMVGIQLVGGDGHLSSCLHVSFRFSDDTDPYAYVVSANIHRRHLTAEQRQHLAARPAVSSVSSSSKRGVEVKVRKGFAKQCQRCWKFDKLWSIAAIRRCRCSARSLRSTAKTIGAGDLPLGKRSKTSAGSRSRCGRRPGRTQTTPASSPRLCPTIDIDILNEPVAIAAEDLVRERFEERGYLLVRIGKPPKRAIPFRTLEPFAKLNTSFVVPKGAPPQKIEFLCDGQQFVAYGIHPDTQKPYNWFGGDPMTIAYDELPYISAEEAQQLQRDVTELLTRDFGYVVGTSRTTRKGKGNGKGNRTPEDSVSDWQSLVDNILAGNDLHDSTRDLAAKMVRSGTDGGAIVNFLRGLMNSSAAPRDERWQNRLDDLPRLVDGFEEKLAREREAEAAAAEASSPPPPPPASPSTGPTPSAAPGPSIENTLKVFREWLLLDNDTPVLAMLGAVAANMLPGDAIWLGIIAPPSSAKTEMLITLVNIPNTELVGTLSVAGLLSGTPRRQQAAGAKGGLLQKIGARGFLVLKDFGSILSMRPDAKAELLAALREVYDGKWTRVIGADGGKTLQWAGKLGLLFGCTRVYDSYYGVLSELGDRFLLCRMEPDDKQFLHAIKYANRAPQMREKLVKAVTDLFATRLPPPRDISDREIRWLNDILQIAVRLRGAVKRDFRTRELEDIYGAEGTARFGKALERVLSGLDCLGVKRSKARRVVRAIAFDSVPPNRLSVYRYLKSRKGRKADTPTVAAAVELPTITARRALEEITVYGLAKRYPQGQGKADLWRAV